MNNAHPSSQDATRRDFLRHSTALLSAGALLAAASSAQARVPGDVSTVPPPPPAGSKRLRLAVIGTGGPGGCAMGLGHALSFLDLDAKQKANCEIAVVCDLNQLHLQYAEAAVNEKYKELGLATKVETTTKYKEVLARNDIDGVIAAVPEHWHAQAGVDAMAAGKDLYLEKPMALNLEHALALYNAQKAAPHVMVQIGTQGTRQPKFHEARAMIQSGLIGTPTISQTSYCRNSKNGEWHYTVNPEWKPGVNLDWDEWCRPLGPMAWDPKVYYQWRRYRKTSTGIIGDLLVHVMTPMMLALGQGWPVRVTANGQHLVDKEMENHDTVSLVAEFETGHQMIVTGATNNEVGLETLIRGHKGNIYLGSRHCEFRPERMYAEEIEPQKVECPDIGNDQDVHRLGFLHSIRTREKPMSSVELGTQVMVVVDLATRAMWEGGTWFFDPSTQQVRKA
jgi:predicted dehydrogenase